MNTRMGALEAMGYAFEITATGYKVWYCGKLLTSCEIGQGEDAMAASLHREVMEDAALYAAEQHWGVVRRNERNVVILARNPCKYDTVRLTEFTTLDAA